MIIDELLREKKLAQITSNELLLLEFQEDYPDVLNGDNLVDILKAAKAKKKRINDND